jgi:hypothetical protein
MPIVFAAVSNSETHRPGDDRPDDEQQSLLSNSVSDTDAKPSFEIWRNKCEFGD